MRAVVPWSMLAIVVALASCATNPPAPDPPSTPEPVQMLLLRTDPAGAACSVFRNGAVVASVAATPGIANVPRRQEPIEVVCRKDDLEQRITFEPVPGFLVAGQELRQPERAKPEGSTGNIAVDVAANVAFQVLATFFPPAAVGIAAVALGASAASSPYAFRPLPRLVLAPAAFDSERSCDEYFRSLKSRLDADADAQRARILESCSAWPCGALEPGCRENSCAGQRARVDAELASQLEQLPGLRARARIAN